MTGLKKDGEDGENHALILNLLGAKVHLIMCVSYETKNYVVLYFPTQAISVKCTAITT